MFLILEILNNDIVNLAINSSDTLIKGTFGLSAIAAVAIGSAVISGGGALIAAGKAKREAESAAGKAQRVEDEIESFKRQPVVNPYSGVKDISGMAKDLSSMIDNPYENLGVATTAAEIQMEQTDIALANTLDTLRASGASAGGATALAQAALQSKKGVASSIEQQEAQNEKLKAQGESEMQRMKMAEQQRIQGVQMSEAQRMQQSEAAGKEFVYREEENRDMQELNRLQNQADQQRQNEANQNQAKAAAWSAGISAVGNIGASAAGNIGASAAGGI